MFITIEGIDGCGKSTLVEGLKEIDNACYEIAGGAVDVVFTKEPYKSFPSDYISELEFCAGIKDATSFFMKDRRLHCEEVIRPALRKNKLVICDRYMDSTWAYQYYWQECDIWRLIDGHEDLPHPNLTILLDMPVENIVKRKELDSFERTIDAEMYERIRQGYLTIAREEPNRVKVIDATQNKDKVLADTLRYISEYSLKNIE